MEYCALKKNSINCLREPFESRWYHETLKIEHWITMPRVAFFFGISIYMYMDDHEKPHCHAMYGDYAGSFSLESGDLCAGQMPTAQLRKIKNFILSNKEDLMIKWNELTA